MDVTNPASEQSGVDWWESLTARGGEGMVVKPLDFVMRGKKGTGSKQLPGLTLVIL